MEKLVLDHARFDAALESMGLTRFWEMVQMVNFAADAPYHNNEHMYGVAIIANQLIGGILGDIQPPRSALLALEYTLAVACLLHDFDHTMGNEADSVNISRALGAVSYTAQWLPDHPKQDLLTAEIKDLISITEYPFRDEPFGLLACCIRDADLLYSMTHPEPRRVLDGLRREMEVSFKRPIDLNELVKLQETFWSTATFYTPLGIKIAPELIKTNLEMVRAWASEES